MQSVYYLKIVVYNINFCVSSSVIIFSHLFLNLTAITYFNIISTKDLHYIIYLDILKLALFQKYLVLPIASLFFHYFSHIIWLYYLTFIVAKRNVVFPVLLIFRWHCIYFRTIKCFLYDTKNHQLFINVTSNDTCSYSQEYQFWGKQGLYIYFCNIHWKSFFRIRDSVFLPLWLEYQLLKEFNWTRFYSGYKTVVILFCWYLFIDITDLMFIYNVC